MSRNSPGGSLSSIGNPAGYPQRFDGSPGRSSGDVEYGPARVGRASTLAFLGRLAPAFGCPLAGGCEQIAHQAAGTVLGCRPRFPVFYAGLILAIVSIGFTLTMSQLSPIRLRAHLGVLILMLYGTAPMVYSQARYAWLYKYIGVAQYVNAHGHVNQHIDIFQNWPGFFAFIAWFDNALGVQNPIAYTEMGPTGHQIAHLHHALVRVPGAAAHRPRTLARSLSLRRVDVDCTGLSVRSGVGCDHLAWAVRTCPASSATSD